jgi:hypothetical protein
MDEIRRSLAGRRRRRTSLVDPARLLAVGAEFEFPTFVARASSFCSDALAADARADHVADAALIACCGGAAPHQRGPALEALLAGPPAPGQPACLLPDCADTRCAGNTVTVAADGSVNLRFSHHKNERRRAAAPISFTIAAGAVGAAVIAKHHARVVAAGGQRAMFRALGEVNVRISKILREDLELGRNATTKSIRRATVAYYTQADIPVADKEGAPPAPARCSPRPPLAPARIGRPHSLGGYSAPAPALTRAPAPALTRALAPTASRQRSR